ncbi:hypothetical protein NP233_g8644 [Leucocoprinus birnbaumii]|uniref:AB hydrolase-1 domain-containing protein n=1 Tax=Leucocoprinus birnbaumii TaxID=56174 RepID=A0AAD5VQJ4_9AGAR|nr:hypothetical protein NP233_g8644 [Leucocoprinus birnbaumii]
MSFSSSTAHLPDGNRIWYTDSGPVKDASTYTSVVLIHGHAFNGHVFEPLHEFAAKHQLRLFAINRRHFAGSSAYSDAELDDLRNGEPAFADRLTVLLGHLVEYFIRKHDLPKPNAERTAGGVMVLGWSLGCATAMTFLSNGKLFNVEQYELLRGYVRKLVLYDPGLVAFGFEGPPGSKPYAMHGNSLEEYYKKFKLNVGLYFDHPIDWDGDSAKLKSEPSSEISTTASWSSELWEKIYQPQSAADSDWPLVIGPIQKVLRQVTERALFNRACIAETFPDLDVFHIDEVPLR